MTARESERPQRFRRTAIVLAKAAFVVVAVAIGVVATFDFREQANRAAVYGGVASAPADALRQQRDIKNRIALLLTPRHGRWSVGRDDSARTIEAALLYGRLALLKEQQGRPQEAAVFMQDAVALLRRAHHPNPTEAHVRATLAAQGGSTGR
jgi:hypothetical protein